MVFKMQAGGKRPAAALLPRALGVLGLLLVLGGKLLADDTNKWWSDATEQSLRQAGTNLSELVTALQKVPEPQRAGLQFLIQNAPVPDLQTLSAPFLLENLSLAHDAFENAPWHDAIPPDIFQNDILPYACVNETRDGWRPLLQKICAPLVADCKTPGEASGRLNEKLFDLIKVHYSTERKKADQSPSESMETGLASCTGLSILLVDACRAVGVPARLAGTPMWSNERGNHTWVEVWDNGWHFVGAAEPDPKGLDHAWFEHDAAEAVADSPAHAIYAASFQKTGVAFPLDWAPDIHWVNAENVTSRYLPRSTPDASRKFHLEVMVVEPESGKRIAAKVSVNDITNSAVHFKGMSKGESADRNNFLAFELPAGGIYQICTELNNQSAVQCLITGTHSLQLVELTLSPCKPLKPRDEAKLKRALSEYFAATGAEQARWKFSSGLEKLLRENELAVRQAAWEACKAAPIHGALAADFAARQATFQNYTSAYTLKYVGQRPTNGWALFIAMHGGGNAPKELNDSQWAKMQVYYKDHPEAGGYIYVAPRAPNDTWNGFYDDYVYPLIANLVQQFVLFGEVNPDKVFIMGYSHGGYGAFAIGPKEPDLFAAIHASAGAPTDGETTARTLRNTIFTGMVGGLDTMYGRRWRDEKFRDEIAGLRGSRSDIYPVTVTVVEGNGHTGLPDRDLIKDLYPAVRNPAPRELTWRMTDPVVTDFFWLHTDAPGKQKEIDATCRDNQLTVTTTNVASATVRLDDRLVDFRKPLIVELNGQKTTQKIQPSLRTLCQTMQRRGDPGLAFTAELALLLAAKPPEK